MQQWADRQLTTFSLIVIPVPPVRRGMDVLSLLARAIYAGYKAVLLAARSYSRYLPMSA